MPFMQASRRRDTVAAAQPPPDITKRRLLKSMVAHDKNTTGHGMRPPRTTRKAGTLAL
jgi:hypothetical protein